jgi:hypothetical protein
MLDAMYGTGFTFIAVSDAVVAVVHPDDTVAAILTRGGAPKTTGLWTVSREWKKDGLTIRVGEPRPLLFVDAQAWHYVSLPGDIRSQVFSRLRDGGPYAVHATLAEAATSLDACWPTGQPRASESGGVAFRHFSNGTVERRTDSAGSQTYDSDGALRFTVDNGPDGRPVQRRHLHRDGSRAHTIFYDGSNPAIYGRDNMLESGPLMIPATGRTIDVHSVCWKDRTYTVRALSKTSSYCPKRREETTPDTRDQTFTMVGNVLLSERLESHYRAYDSDGWDPPTHLLISEETYYPDGTVKRGHDGHARWPNGQVKDAVAEWGNHRKKTTFYASGSPERIESQTFDRMSPSRTTSVTTVYYESGAVQSVRNTVGGIASGASLDAFEDGTPRTRGMMMYGAKFGVWEHWVSPGVQLHDTTHHLA